MLQQIQLHPAALGYKSGNTDAILDSITQVAISQFSAEHGLKVTGETNETVAVTLANEVKDFGT